MTKQRLVSVVVVSYNAEDTVLETLNSVLNQTYQNVELVLSDDCSKDNTVEVARKWFDENSAAFKGGAHMLTAEKNQGVCANFNKAIRSAKGEWIKIIAADDILLPNCCADYINFVNHHTEAHFVTGNIDVYNESFNEGNLLEKGKQAAPPSVYELTVKEQLRIAAKAMIVSGAAVFYSKTLFDDINGYNEEYPFEDWPSVISALEHGYKIYHLCKSTVGYRYHSSLSNKSGKLFNIIFRRKIRLFFKRECFKYLDKRSIILMKSQWLLEEVLDFFCLNRNNIIGNKIMNILVGLKKKGKSNV